MGNDNLTFDSTHQPYMDKEVKKRCGAHLKWDVSYKEAKHLAQYKGQSLYHGLVSAMNEFNETRLQFHVVTDGQDQFVGPIQVNLDELIL